MIPTLIIMFNDSAARRLLLQALLLITTLTNVQGQSPNGSISSSDCPTIASIVSTPAGCGAPDGTITITAAGGAGPYEYSLDGISFQASNQFKSLSAATYTVTVRDATLCSAISVQTVIGSTPPTLALTSTDDACGAPSGSISASANGGAFPYEYSINGAAFQASSVFNSLAAATYNVTVRDARGCTKTSIQVVGNLSGPTVDAVLTTSSCGNSNGSVTLMATGGTAPYGYSIDGITFVADPLFSALAAGNYSFTVKDANNCSAIKSIAVNNSTGAAVFGTATTASCANNDGTILVKGIGGVTPYEFSINGSAFSTKSFFSTLSAGSYIVSIRDANACITSTTIVIDATPGLTATTVISAATCGTKTGSIKVLTVGGLAPFAYSIDGTNFQSGNLFGLLGSGSYNIYVKDANNCTATAAVTVPDNSGASLSVTTNNASCGNSNGSVSVVITGGTAPYSYSLDGKLFQSSNQFPGLASGNIIITVRDAAGCISAIVATIGKSGLPVVSAGNDVQVCSGSTVQLSATANSGTISWFPSTGLSDASALRPLASPQQTTLYVLSVSNGACIGKDSVLVVVNQLPIANAGKDTTVCSGNNITLNGRGGAQYQWSPALTLSNASIANPVVHAGLGTFQYTLQVTDINGCKSKLPDTVTVQILPTARVFAGNDTTVAVGRPFQLHAVDVDQAGFQQYAWTPASDLSNPFAASPLATLKHDQLFTVAARALSGCVATDQVQVRVFQQTGLFVPNAFTPNNDGRNDLLHVIQRGIKALKYFRVFNRWGQLVFSTTTPDKGWDGTLNGLPQKSGNFLWMAEAIDVDDKMIVRKGFVLLIR